MKLVLKLPPKPAEIDGNSLSVKQGSGTKKGAAKKGEHKKGASEKGPNRGLPSQNLQQNVSNVSAKGKAEKASKKRKREGQNGIEGQIEDAKRRQENGTPAQRDLYGEGLRNNQSERGTEGNQNQPKLPPMPKLVIRSSFKAQIGAGKAQQATNNPNSPLKKKRKKKKEKLPTDNVAGKQDANGQELKEPLGKTPTLIASVLPAKRPLEKHESHPNQQATSTFTVQSNDGAGATSNFSGLRQTSIGATGQEAISSGGKPSQQDIERLLSRLQKKDLHNIFKNPVTDAVAPGYSAVIKRPMSFSQMQGYLKDGVYASWDAVQKDLELMFNNAMVFNEPNTHYHQKAREMMGISRKLLQAIKETGSLDGRGRVSRGPSNRTADGLSSQNLIPAAEKRTERRASTVKAADRPVKLPKGESKRKVAARKAAQRALANGILARPNAEDGRGEVVPLSVEENSRITFASLLGNAVEQTWKGLARGSNALGLRFSDGHHALRASYIGSLGVEHYKDSLQNFIGRSCPAAQQMLERVVQVASDLASSPAPESIREEHSQRGPSIANSTQFFPAPFQTQPISGRPPDEQPHLLTQANGVSAHNQAGSLDTNSNKNLTPIEQPSASIYSGQAVQQRSHPNQPP